MGQLFWTPVEDALLLELVGGGGHSFNDIIRRGDFPGRTRSALIGRFHRLTNLGDPLRRTVTARRTVPKPTPEPRPRPVMLAAVTAPRVSQPLPAADVGDVPTVLKSIWQLGPNDCRYPLPAPKSDHVISHVFCGAPVELGSAYCTHHGFCAFRRARSA